MVGVKVGLSSDNRLLEDPDSEEDWVRDGGGELTLGYLANLEQAVCLMCEGVMTGDAVSKALMFATRPGASTGVLQTPGLESSGGVT